MEEERKCKNCAYYDKDKGFCYFLSKIVDKDDQCDDFAEV